MTELPFYHMRLIHIYAHVTQGILHMKCKMCKNISAFCKYQTFDTST